MLESELFGHVKGPFTGAISAREGAIETAHGGTVFLDEIGELPPTMQPKLLRTIESRTVRRIGEAAYREVDVRFIAATHRDLASMVGVGAFREDLFFRLAVLPLDVPPLRERRDDIPLLARTFAEESPATHLDDVTIDALIAYPWLGNIRELRNFVERVRAVGAAQALTMLRGGDPVTASPRASAPPPALSPPAWSALPAAPLDRPFKELREEWNDHLERDYFAGLVRKLGRNVPAVADAAQLDQTYVRRMLRKHEL